MEELLPLESYHAQSEGTLRRRSGAAGLAFGLIMGSGLALGIASAVGPVTSVLAGIATAIITGSVFAGAWGWSMLRLARAANERVHDNDAELMGESLEDSFRYRMPCSLLEGPRLIPGTLYLDRDRGAFVPVRKLAGSVEITRFSLGPASFFAMPWHEGSWWARWTLGAPRTLEVASDGRVRSFVTPDADLAVARLRDALPAHSHDAQDEIPPVTDWPNT